MDESVEISSTWAFKIVDMAMSLPGVKVRRNSFLLEELEDYCTSNDISIEELLKLGPLQAGIPKTKVEEIAQKCISDENISASSKSAFAGLFSNPLAAAFWGTADIVNYFCHLIIVSQKIAFLYDWPDIFDETDEGKQIILMFLGGAFDCNAAKNGIKLLARKIVENELTRIDKITFLFIKPMFYKIIQQVAKYIGVSFSKQGLKNAVTKTVPIVGAVLSGGINYFMFRNDANRLLDVIKCAPITSKPKTLSSDYNLKLIETSGELIE